MIGRSLRQLQAVLDGKADALQHEFVAAGDRVRAIGSQLASMPPDEVPALLAEQQALRAKQHALADEINLWRDRARGVLRQPGEDALQTYLQSLQAIDDAAVQAAAAHALTMLATPEEELARMADAQTRARPTTPVGRLAERARSDYDLRGDDPAPRRRAAFEFARRPGLAQDDATLAELEAALNDPDAQVRELLTLALIQIHRFRALSLADLDTGLAAVERLARVEHPAVIPVLIEIVETARTGFVRGDTGMVASHNRRERILAMRRLAAWRTPEAQAALRARRFDREAEIVDAATQLLEANPGDW
jgi:hypothetical protein